MIDAVITSVGEPQVERCLESAEKQEAPFKNVIHIDGVVPASEALNKGIDQVKSEWFMYIGGDMILYPNATQVANRYAFGRKNANALGYFFLVRDTFLDCDMGWLCLLRTSCYKDERPLDTMWDDRKITYRLRAKGFRARKKLIVLGTHFDRPTAFQVFCRFYFHGMKFIHNGSGDKMIRTLYDLYVRRNDPLYAIGMKAIEFARKTRAYRGSPNLTLNKKLYEEFKCWT